MLGSLDSVVLYILHLKQIVLILSRLSDAAQGRRGLYFQAQALYLSLITS